MGEWLGGRISHDDDDDDGGGGGLKVMARYGCVVKVLPESEPHTCHQTHTHTQHYHVPSQDLGPESVCTGVYPPLTLLCGCRIPAGTLYGAKYATTVLSNSAPAYTGYEPPKVSSKDL